MRLLAILLAVLASPLFFSSALSAPPQAPRLPVAPDEVDDTVPAPGPAPVPFVPAKEPGPEPRRPARPARPVRPSQPVGYQPAVRYVRYVAPVRYAPAQAPVYQAPAYPAGFLTGPGGGRRVFPLFRRGGPAMGPQCAPGGG